jgi:hypothetical protein
LKGTKKEEAKIDVLLAEEYAAVVESDHVQMTEWVVDSGASSHICANQNWFSTYSPLHPPHPIYLGVTTGQN